MIVRKKEPFRTGYNPITEQRGVHSDMLLDFGILKLNPGEVWKDESSRERAFMLIQGHAEWSWEGNRREARRGSCFDENPATLHVSSGVPVEIRAVGPCELAVEACENSKSFPSRFFAPEDVRCDVFGAGVLNEASIRTVRTVFDGGNAPDSNMVLGEVINHPGKWSSYPPHHHPQPEIYHYRFFPEQGFGVSLLDDDAQVVRDGDSSLLDPHRTHSQVAAAGYAMYYIWMIPHLPDDRWLPTTRYFVADHEWLLEKDVKIWPERKVPESK